MEHKIIDINEQKEKYLDEYEEVLSSYIDILKKLQIAPVPGYLKASLKKGISSLKMKQAEVRSFREQV